MLGKLIKYEYKATARTFIPIYIALLLVAAINRVFRIGNIEKAWGISTIILVGLFIGLGVLTIIMIIERFNKNLLGDEGYLMFTLPVKSGQLILSKLIMSMIWTIISSIIAAITFCILFGEVALFDELFTNSDIIWMEFKNILQGQKYISHPILFIELIGISAIISYISFIFKVYLSLAAAQLPIFNKHRTIVTFIVFFGINIVLSTFSKIIKLIIPATVFYNFSSVFILMIATGIIVCSILFIAIKWILDKHLNLE